MLRTPAPGQVQRCGRSGRADVEPQLQPLQPAEQGAVVRSGGRQQHPGAQQLQQEPRSRRTPHLHQSGVQQVGRAGQPGRAEQPGLATHPFELVGRAVQQVLRPRLGHRVQHDQVAQPLEHVLGEATWVVPALHDGVHGGEDRCRVGRRKRVDHVVEQGVRGDAQQSGRGRPRHAALTRGRHHLVQDRQSVPGRSGSSAYDEGQHRRLHVDALGRHHLGEQRGQVAPRHQAERVVVGAGTDGLQHLLGLGRGEDEAQEVRRLLDQLEQGVEALPRDHVRLVDDVDLEARGHRRVERPLPQVTGVVHPAVGGRVDLDDVERARPVGRQRHAGVAHPARVGGRSLLAVERSGQDPGAGGLAAAARAAEQVGVVHPSVAERLAQRDGDVVLALDLGEGGRPVLAVERQAHLRLPSAVVTRRHASWDPGVEDPPHTRPEPAYPCCLPALGEFSEMGAVRGVCIHSSRGPSDKVHRANSGSWRGGDHYG